MQFGKFQERAIHDDSTNQTKDIELVRFSNSKSGEELNRLKGAQCVENGWWLSRNDCVGEATENRLVKGKGKEQSKILELKKLTMPVGMIVDEADVA